MARPLREQMPNNEDGLRLEMNARVETKELETVKRSGRTRRIVGRVLMLAGVVAVAVGGVWNLLRKAEGK